METLKAIIISDDHYNALGMARSIGVLKIDINMILTTKSNTYVNLSRYVNYYYHVNPIGNEIIEKITELVAKDESTYVLFPLSDFSAQIIDDHFNCFPTNVIVPNMKGKMKYYSNKFIMKELAKKYNLLVPEGTRVSLEDFKLDWNKFPAIVKPIMSVEGYKSDIKKVNNLETLGKVLDNLKEKGYSEVLIEEFICGEDEHMIEIMGERINNKNNIRYSRIIQKIREFPIENGSTSYAKIVDKHNGIDYRNISKMLEAVEFEGIFDIEFKYANKKLYFIECNFRNGAPGWALTKNGINLPQMWLEDILETEIDFNIKICKKNTFMCEQNDIINMIKGKPNFFTWLIQFIFANKIFWDYRDIKPALKYYQLFILKQFSKKLKRGLRC